MKSFVTSSISSGSKAKLYKAAFEHLLSSYKELADSLVKSQIPLAYETGKLVVLHGVIITSPSSNVYVWTSGSVYYNGEIFKVESGTVTKTNIETLVFVIQETKTQSVFSDGTSRDWLMDRKVSLVGSNSGSSGGNILVGEYQSLIHINGWNTLTSGVFQAPPTIDGATISDYGVRYRAERHVMFLELFIQATVTNASEFNSSPDVGFELNITLLESLKALPLEDNDLASMQGIVSVNNNVGVINVQVEGQSLSGFCLVDNTTVANGNTIQINVSGTYPLKG